MATYKTIVVHHGAMAYSRSTGAYHDTDNDVVVGRRPGGRLWEVSERTDGNRRVLHSRHRDLAKALAAANELHDKRRAEFRRRWAA